jgi:hypothetical protein
LGKPNRDRAEVELKFTIMLAEILPTDGLQQYIRVLQPRPDAAARKIMEIAKRSRAGDGRIHIELINTARCQTTNKRTARKLPLSLSRSLSIK